jgi:transcriptional regulator with XRE-family HTH domain
MPDKYKEIGEILAAARRDQNKTLKSASESTKIMEQYLMALEAGKPEKLPSNAYFQLFARSYAQYLGIDANVFDEIEENNLAVNGIAAEGKAPEAVDEEKAEAVSQSQARKFGRSLIYLASVIVVIFIAFIVYSQFFMGDSESAFLREMTDTLTGESDASSSEETATDQLIIPANPYEAFEKLKMYMKVKQDVWAIVVRDGDTILNRRLLAGEERLWEADYRYHVTLGISTAVDLYVNDQMLAPLTDRARTIAGLEINQINYKDFLPGAREPEAPVQTDGMEGAEQNTGQESSSPGGQIKNAVDTSDRDAFDGN